MNQLMETLLHLLDHSQTDALTQARADAKEAIQAAEKHLTVDEFDNLWAAVFDIARADDLSSFILGFRLGVQLMLEGLKPIYPN